MIHRAGTWLSCPKTVLLSKMVSILLDRLEKPARVGGTLGKSTRATDSSPFNLFSLSLSSTTRPSLSTATPLQHKLSRQLGPSVASEKVSNAFLSDSEMQRAREVFSYGTIAVPALFEPTARRTASKQSVSRKGRLGLIHLVAETVVAERERGSCATVGVAVFDQALNNLSSTGENTPSMMAPQVVRRGFLTSTPRKGIGGPTCKVGVVELQPVRSG